MSDLKIVIDQQVKNPQVIKQVIQDVKELGRAGADSSTGIGQADRAGGLLNSTFAKLAAAGVIAAAGQKMLEFGKASIAAASEVEEAASKFANVFGPEAEKVGKSLDSFAEAAGRSRYEMRSMAGDLGALLVPMVGNTEAAGEMSVELAKLATDLSSFFNVAESDALTALRAGLVGETEPMRQFGVNISAAAVEARILASGIVETKAEITDAMKVQERFNMIIEGTALAHNDAIETSGSYANQQRNLQAAVQELQVAIGQELLPSMTELTTITAGATREMIGFVKPLSAINSAVGDMARIFSAGNVITQAYGAVMKLAGDETEKVTDAAVLNRRAIEGSADAYRDFATAAQGTIPPIEEATQSIREYHQAASEAAGANQELGDKMAQAAAQTGSSEQMVRAANLELEINARKAEEAAEAAAELAEMQKELAAATGDYFETALEAGPATESLAMQLYDKAAAAGLGAESMALIAAATGEFSQAEIDAAFNAALMQANLDSLVVGIQEGTISVDQATAAVELLQTGQAATAAEALNTANAMAEEKTKAAELAAELDGLAGFYEAEVNVDTGDALTRLKEIQNLIAAIAAGGVGVDVTVGGGGRAMGGPVQAGVAYDVGERGPEKFVAPADGYIVPHDQLGGGTSITVNVYGGGDNVGVMARDGVLDAARQIGLRGF